MSTTKITPKEFIEAFTANTSERKLFLGTELTDQQRELIIINKDHLNGRLTPLLTDFLRGFNPSQRAIPLQDIFNLIEKEGVKEGVPPVKNEVVSVVKNTEKKQSRERRKIAQAIQAELYRMIGINKTSGNIQTDVKNHRNAELKDYKKMVFALIDDADDVAKEDIDQLSVNETFAPLFGVIPGKEILLSRQHKAAADLLTTRYQQSLFPKTGTVSDKEISDSFKDKVLLSVATEIAKVFEEPVSEIKQQIEPEYAGALDDVKMLIFGKE